MTFNWSDVISALVGGVLVALITWLRQRHVTRAEAEKLGAEAKRILAEAEAVATKTELEVASQWRDFAEAMEKRCEQLDTKYEALRRKQAAVVEELEQFKGQVSKVVLELWRGIRALMTQLEEARIMPAYEPSSALMAFIQEQFPDEML